MFYILRLSARCADSIVQNKVEEAAMARVTAQNHLDHYNKKLEEERAKLARAETLAAEVQTEFEVRHFFGFGIEIPSRVLYTDLEGKGNRVLPSNRKSP